MSDNLKKLTGKNPKDFESVAYNLINNSDVELFKELVEKEDFLFDFVKKNVSNRLEKVCNESNYLNLLNFLKYYSPSYEEFIVSNLAKFADEDLTDKMLDIFENGTDDEKTYCAKFFSYIQDPLALEFLEQNAFGDNSALSANCASTLATMGERSAYEKALEMIKSDDGFVQLDGVKFLVAYGNKDAVPFIIETVKKSSFAENIAGELLYLTDLFTLFNDNYKDAMYIANLIINGLGVVNAADKFETLTENDEYLFDETKETKQEILEIKKLLSNIEFSLLYMLADGELNPESSFVYTALDFTENEQKVRELLSSVNPTVVLKALETLKRFDSITLEDKNIALSAVVDENIKNVIMAI